MILMSLLPTSWWVTPLYTTPSFSFVPSVYVEGGEGAVGGESLLGNERKK